MAEGMLKSAPVTSGPAPAPEHSVSETPMSANGVPLEIARHFDVDIFNADDRSLTSLQGISRYLDGKPMGQFLQEIRDIELHLGARMKRDGYHRVYSYLKLTGQANDTLKQRDALRG